MVSVSGPLVALYKDFAINPKLGIQILQNIAIPKKEWSCCLVVGGVSSVIAYILSSDSCLDPGVRIYPSLFLASNLGLFRRESISPVPKEVQSLDSVTI